MKKVLLINFPFQAKGMPTIMPIHQAALGAYLQDHGHQVRIVDLNVAPKQKLYEAIKADTYDLVAVSFRNVLPAFFIERFKALRAFVQELNRLGIDPVVGGPGFSLFHPIIFKRIPELNMGALGEGEHTLLRLVEGDSKDSIPGLCYRSGNSFISNYPPVYLKGSDIPCYREIEGLDFANPEYLVGLQTYRGCNYECSYCPVKVLRGHDCRLRPLERVEQDLDFLADHGVSHVFVIDGVFNDPPGRSFELIDLISKKQGITSWEGFLKPKADVDEAYIEKLAASGLARLHIDVISGTKRVNPLIRHDVSIDETYRAAKLMKKYDIEGIFYFAYQLPTEKLSDELETMRQVKNIQAMGQRTYIYPFFPYPDTGFEKYYGKILEKSWLWHALRIVKMILRPAFFMFLKNMISLDEMTGPRKTIKQ